MGRNYDIPPSKNNVSHCLRSEETKTLSSVIQGPINIKNGSDSVFNDTPRLNQEISQMGPDLDGI